MDGGSEFSDSQASSPDLSVTGWLCPVLGKFRLLCK